MSQPDPINGPRYKLVSQDNYDLCDNCFNAIGADENEYEKIEASIGRLLVGRMPRMPRNPEQPPNRFAASSSRTNLPSTGKGKAIAGSCSIDTSSKGDMNGMVESGQALQNYNLRYLFGGDTASGSQYFVSTSELEELLLAKDGRYDLDALAMATLHGNVDIIMLLVYALGEIDKAPYNIIKSESFLCEGSVGNDSSQRIELRKVTNEVIGHFRGKEPEFMEACMEEYHRHWGFKFLPIEYVFHFAWTSRFEKVFHDEHKRDFRNWFWAEVRKWPDQHLGELWRFLLKLHDGQGRTPMDVAMDEVTDIEFYNLLDKSLTVGSDAHNYVLSFAAKAPDGSGKFPAHRAVVMRTGSLVINQVCREEGVSAKYCENTEHPILSALEARSISVYDLGKFSKANGFRDGLSSSTPLQLAIIHNNFEVGKNLFESARSNEERAWKMKYQFYFWESYGLTADIIQLVCYVGADSQWIRLLLKEYLQKLRQINPRKAKKASDLGGLCCIF